MQRKSKEYRRYLVAELKALAATIGRTPTRAEISRHWGKAWNVMAHSFVGRPRHRVNGMPSTPQWTNGLHRWYRLCGLKANAPGKRVTKNPPRPKLLQRHLPPLTPAAPRGLNPRTEKAQLWRLEQALAAEQSALRQAAYRCPYCDGIVKPGTPHDKCPGTRKGVAA